MKKCNKCKEVKNFIYFGKNKAKKDGHQGSCRKCFKVYRDKHYFENKEYYLNKNNELRREKAEFIKKIKEKGFCVHCGENNVACLDFHHVEDSTKDYNIANMASFSKETILKEIKKCIILCANCHRKLHFDISSSGV